MRFFFGDYELDADRFELRLNGNPVPIERRVLDLILLLIRQRSRVVSRAELCRALWPDVNVDDNHSLDQALYTARRSLGDTATNPTYIKTIRGKGLRFIAQVRQSTARPTTLRLEPSPFVGRAAPLSRLYASASSHKHRPLLSVISGEPGVGKTRLIEEFARDQRSAGTPCALVRCSASLGMPAFWPWRVALNQLSAIRDRAGRDAFAGAQTSTTRRGVGRWELFEGVVVALRAVSDLGAVVILDDLQACEAASLALLQHVLASPDLNLTIVAACRVHDFHMDQAAERVSPSTLDLLETLASDRIELSGLDTDSTAEFTQHYLGNALDTEYISWLHTNTGGNPLFLRHLCEALTDQEPGSRRTPPSLRQLIRSRVRSIDEQARGTLEVASVVGAEFDERLVREVRGAEVSHHLESAEQAGILLRIDKHGRYRFVHDLLREQLWSQTPSSKRSKFHGRIVRILERSSDSGAVNALADHAYFAGQEVEPNRVIELLQSAGRWALENHAYEDAVHHFGRAVERCQTLGEESLDLRLLLGRSLLLSGQPRQAREHLVAVCRLAESQGNWQVCGEAALALAPGLLSIEAGVTDPVVVSSLRAALAGVEGKTHLNSLRALLLGRLAMAMYWDASQAQERKALVDESLALASGASVEMRIQAEVTAYRIGAMWNPQDRGERIRLGKKLIEFADRSRQVELALIGHVFSIASLIEEGDMDGAVIHLGALRSRLEASPLPQARWYPVAYAAMFAAARGKLEEAEALSRSVLEDGARFGDANVVNSFAPMLIFIRWQQSRLREVLHLMPPLAERFPAVAAWRVGYAYMCWECGEVRRAKEAYAQLVRSWDAWDLNLTWLLSATMLGDLVADLGDMSQAAALRDAIGACEGGAICVGYGVGYWGSVDRVIGRLEALLGRRRGALCYLRKAVDFERRVGSRVWRGRAELDLADVLLKGGRERDMEEARQLCRDVSRKASRDGLSMLRNRAEALSRQIVKMAGA